MKILVIRKYAMFFIVIVILFISLYISMNFSSDEVKTIFEKIYATSTKKTAQSSISTNVPSTGADMVQLLARLINR